MPITFPDNAIAWAQFNRKGGMKSVVSVALGYGCIISVLILVTARLNPRYTQDVYAGWATGLLALQSLFVVIIGAGRVSQMIRQDITSGIAESHRMMPLSPAHAIAGYMSAAAAAMSGLFFANLAVGAAVTMLAQLPPGRWVAANLILLAFAVFIWTIAAFLAFLAKQAGGVIAVSSVAGLFGNTPLLFVAPAVVVLTGPLIGGSIFNLRTAQTEMSAPLVCSLASQILVGSIFFTGAARKYRRPDDLALGGFLGELLLLAMVGISVLAIVQWEAFQPGFMARQFRDAPPAVPFIGSTVLCLIVALAPLANFARQHVSWTRLRLDDPGARRSVPGPLGCGLMVTATLLLLMLAVPKPPTAAQFAYTACAFLGLSLSIIFLAAWVYRIVDNAKLFIGIWIGLYAALPLVIDLVRHGLSDNDLDATLGIVSSFSPIGLVIQTWTESTTDLRVGAVFHLIAPLLPIGLYARDVLKRPTSPPPLPA